MGPLTPKPLVNVREGEFTHTYARGTIKATLTLAHARNAMRMGLPDWRSFVDHSRERVGLLSATSSIPRSVRSLADLQADCHSSSRTAHSRRGMVMFSRSRFCYDGGLTVSVFSSVRLGAKFMQPDFFSFRLILIGARIVLQVWAWRAGWRGWSILVLLLNELGHFALGVLLALRPGENPVDPDAKHLLIDVAFVGVLIFMIVRGRQRPQAA